MDAVLARPPVVTRSIFSSTRKRRKKTSTDKQRKNKEKNRRRGKGGWEKRRINQKSHALLRLLVSSQKTTRSGSGNHYDYGRRGERRRYLLVNYFWNLCEWCFEGGEEKREGSDVEEIEETDGDSSPHDGSKRCRLLDSTHLMERDWRDRVEK